MADDIIDMIDKTVTDYAVSADAMRWSPEPLEPAPLRSGGIIAGTVPMFGDPDTCTLFIPLDLTRRLEALRPAIGAMTAFFGTLSEQLQPLVAAMNKLALQLPQPPVRGCPRPLAADGLSYHRRYLARRRRR